MRKENVLSAAAALLLALFLFTSGVLAQSAEADVWILNTEGRPIRCGNAADAYHEDVPTAYPVIRDERGEEMSADALLRTGCLLSYGSVSRPVVLRGDLLATGTFDISQLVALSRLLAGQEAGPLAQAAGDMNGSGSPDIADLVALARYVTNPKPPEAASPYPPPEPSGEKKILVACFSATGRTERVAELLAEDLGAELFAITPVEPYTQADLDYGDPDSRVCRERADEELRNVALVQTTPDGFDGYDAVFIGYPVWWGEAAWPVDNFVIDNDFSGKDVYCFCTSASSPLGQSAERLKAMSGSGDWKGAARFPSGASAQSVQEWVDSLDL